MAFKLPVNIRKLRYGRLSLGEQRSLALKASTGIVISLLLSFAKAEHETTTDSVLFVREGKFLPGYFERGKI